MTKREEEDWFVWEEVFSITIEKGDKRVSGRDEVRKERETRWEFGQR